MGAERAAVARAKRGGRQGRAVRRGHVEHQWTWQAQARGHCVSRKGLIAGPVGLQGGALRAAPRLDSDHPFHRVSAAPAAPAAHKQPSVLSVFRFALHPFSPSHPLAPHHVSPAAFAMADKPIVFSEHVQLASLGVPPTAISFSSVTLESENFVCVREEGSVVIVDLNDISNVYVLTLPGRAQICIPAEPLRLLCSDFSLPF